MKANVDATLFMKILLKMVSRQSTCLIVRARLGWGTLNLLRAYNVCRSNAILVSFWQLPSQGSSSFRDS